MLTERHWLLDFVRPTGSAAAARSRTARFLPAFLPRMTAGVTFSSDGRTQLFLHSRTLWTCLNILFRVAPTLQVRRPDLGHSRLKEGTRCASPRQWTARISPPPPLRHGCVVNQWSPSRCRLIRDGSVRRSLGKKRTRRTPDLIPITSCSASFDPVPERIRR